jgi:plastocyanin
MKIAIVLGILAMLLVVGCASQTTTTQLADFPENSEEESSLVVPTGHVNQVVINHGEFMPRTVEISKGDTVEWVNTDSRKLLVEDEDEAELEIVNFNHAILSEEGDFSFYLATGNTVTKTFLEKGVFTYTSNFNVQNVDLVDENQARGTAQGIVVVN